MFQSIEKIFQDTILYYNHNVSVLSIVSALVKSSHFCLSNCRILHHNSSALTQYLITHGKSSLPQTDLLPSDPLTCAPVTILFLQSSPSNRRFSSLLLDSWATQYPELHLYYKYELPIPYISILIHSVVFISSREKPILSRVLATCRDHPEHLNWKVVSPSYQ